MTQIFSTIHLFQGLDSTGLQPLEQVATVRAYEVGQVIMLEGELNTPVFFVLEGQVRAFRMNPDGREQTLARLQTGDVFNVPTAFDTKGDAPATAVAQDPSRLIVVDQTDFRRVTSQNPQIALVVLQELSNKLKHLVGANLVAGGTIVEERFLRGAPLLAPMLFSNVSILGLIVLLPSVEQRT